MKKILMVGTGGTIASEMTAEGLAPELNTEQLLEFIPDIGKFCRVDCLQLYNLDSTNIRPADWLGVADILRKSYDAYDGFVISHGTDTMAYTAAALSYLVQRQAHRPHRGPKAHLVRRHGLQAQPDGRLSLRLPGLRGRADRL